MLLLKTNADVAKATKTERVVSKTERVFLSTGIDPPHEPVIILSFFIRMPKF